MKDNKTVLQNLFVCENSSISDQTLLSIFENRDYSQMDYRVIVIENKLPFTSAGVFFAMITDPNNRKPEMFFMAKGDPVIKQPALMLNVLPDEHGRTIVIAGVMKNDLNAVQLLRKFDKLKKGELGHALTSLVFNSNKSNTFFHPQFWEHLKQKGLNDLIEKELNEERGFDLMNQSLKLSKLNLFSPQYYCSNLGID